jgi:hypothetical protein
MTSLSQDLLLLILPWALIGKGFSRIIQRAFYQASILYSKYALHRTLPADENPWTPKTLHSSNPKSQGAVAPSCIPIIKDEEEFMERIKPRHAFLKNPLPNISVLKALWIAKDLARR